MADGSHAPGPRCDLDAEAAVLSAALLDEGAALELVECLSPRDFYSDANRRVFSAISDIAQQGGAPDIVTVAGALRANGRLEQLGGSAYLAQLANATPAISHLRDHAKIIRNLARLRHALDAFRVMAAEAATIDLHDIDEWLESCETRSYAATAERRDAEETAATYRELAVANYDAIEKAYAASQRDEPRRYGISTGFRCLDDHLGGYHPGQLIVIGARPRCGKTSFMLQIAEAIARQNYAVIILSLEMTKGQLMARSQARLSGTPSRQLLEGNPTSWDQLTSATEFLGGLPIMIDDDSNVTPLRVRAKVRRLYAKIRSQFPGIGLGAVFVDYLQLMHSDNASSRRNDNRATVIGEFTFGLKQLAKQLKVPVIALSQLTRPDPKAKVLPPTLESLRESGCIEQDADVVQLIHREDLYRPPREAWSNDADIILAKVREAEEGVHKLKWNGKRTEFYEEQGSFA